MGRQLTVARTPWQRGRLDGWGQRPKLLFGQMYEDYAVETSVFPARGRVFAIASAGSTAMALAVRGLDVTAVDINPAQIAYVRDRLAGGPPRMGTGDRLFSIGRRFLPLLGWSRRCVRNFLELTDPAQQLEYWHRQLDTVRFRAAMSLLLRRASLGLVYNRQLLRVVPPRFDLVMRHRLERCFAHHPNRSNPYAWRLLLGIDQPDQIPVEGTHGPIELVEADAASYLEGCGPASFDAFTLSNILDGTDNAYRDRVLAAVRRAARAGAVMILRSFAEPANDDDDRWATKDRSMLWGSIRVIRVGG